MTTKEIKKQITEMKKYTKEIARSETKEEAKDFLIKAGICNKNGRLRKPYK